MLLVKVSVVSRPARSWLRHETAFFYCLRLKDLLTQILGGLGPRGYGVLQTRAVKAVAVNQRLLLKTVITTSLPTLMKLELIIICYRIIIQPVDLLDMYAFIDCCLFRLLAIRKSLDWVYLLGIRLEEAVGGTTV